MVVPPLDIAVHQNPATMLFVASFTIDVGATDLHYAYDGAKLVLI